MFKLTQNPIGSFTKARRELRKNMGPFIFLAQYDSTMDRCQSRATVRSRPQILPRQSRADASVIPPLICKPLPPSTQSSVAAPRNGQITTFLEPQDHPDIWIGRI